MTKELHFNKIMSCIYERLYIDLFEFDHIEYTSHVSRFAERLISEIPALENRIIKRKVVPEVLAPNFC